LTEAYPDYHPTFTYHSFNSYAYIVSRYGNSAAGPTFDWVCVQLYETWSRAHQNISYIGQPADDYLNRLMPYYLDGFEVDFSSVPALNWPSQRVRLNASQVVIGLANGWADPTRVLLVEPSEVGKSYNALKAAGKAPRGYAYWDVGDEGITPTGWTSPLFMAEGLNEFLHIRG
jgi:hypothetical protein